MADPAYDRLAGSAYRQDRDRPVLSGLLCLSFRPRRSPDASLKYLVRHTALTWCLLSPLRLEKPSGPNWQKLKVIQYGEPCWDRTSDLLIKSQLLYRLS